MTRQTKKKASKKTGEQPGQQQNGIDPNLGEYVLVPAAVVEQIINTLGQIALNLGGLTTALQNTARPLGQKKAD